MRIITLAIPDTHAGFRVLTSSATRAGLEIEEVSKGRPWKGFRTKMEAFLEAARQTEDLMVIVDAFDVIVHPQAAEKLRGVEAWFAANPKTHMLAGCESSCIVSDNCLPLENWKLSKQTEAKHFVNSGIVCGRAPAIREWTQFMIDNEFHDDQLGLASFMNLKRAPYVELDTTRMLVHNVTGLHHLVPPDITAAFGHFPGQSLIITPRWAYAFYARKWAHVQEKYGLVPVWIILGILAVLTAMILVLPASFLCGAGIVGAAWGYVGIQNFL